MTDNKEPRIIEFESSPTLDEMHAALSWDGEPGWIERVPFFSSYKGRRCDAICHEEGKVIGLPKNIPATQAWYDVCPDIIGHDYLVGNILIIYGGIK